MLSVEQQLGTGRRIQLPSEDTASASRAVSLQRMLEVKTQLRTNLSTNQSYLDATDTRLERCCRIAGRSSRSGGASGGHHDQ